jgi:hypothetical protein
MPLASATHGVRLLAALVLLVAGCSAREAESLPTRPPVPDGWVEITRGSVQVAVPAEWGLDIGGDPSSIMVSALLPPGDNNSVGLIAVGPRGEVQPRPPLTDERLAEFLLTWGTSRPPEVYSRSIVLIPAGRAVAIRATHMPGTPDSTEVHVYGIPTSVGVAVIQIIVDTDLMDRYGSAMELIPHLFQFGFAETR